MVVTLTRLNSFVGTYMEREAQQLMVENLSKKYVPQTVHLKLEPREAPFESPNNTRRFCVAWPTQMSTQP